MPDGAGLMLPEYGKCKTKRTGGNLQDDVKAERVGNGMVEDVRFVGVGVFPMGIDVMQLQFQKCVLFFFSTL